MGDKCRGSYAIIDRLGTKVQRGKGSKVFVEAHCSASSERLVNLISQSRSPEASGAKFFIKRTVCHPEERRITQEIRQRLAILFAEYWM
jgi:hypothetical protein